jgi:hypothetical protein
MASVISGLPDLTGYIKSQDLAIQATFTYVGAEKRNAGFIPRYSTTGVPLVFAPENAFGG